MFTDYLQALFINLLLIVGIWKVFQPEMLLGPLGDWLCRRLGEYPMKPLFVCPPCMASVWGTGFFWISRLHEHLPWYIWPVHCLVLCGLTTLAMMMDHD